MELKACRVCLATDLKLFSLNKGGLRQVFREITELPVSPKDDLPQHICYICSALLQKYVSFKAKCHDTNDLLQGIRSRGGMITQEYIKTLNKAPYLTIFSDNMNTVDDNPETSETYEEIEYIEEGIFDIKEEIDRDDNGTDETKVNSEGNILLDIDEVKANIYYNIFKNDDAVVKAETDTENVIQITDSFKAVKPVKKLKGQKAKKKLSTQAEHFTDSDDELLTLKKIKYTNMTKDQRLLNKFVKKTEAAREFARNFNARATFYTKEEQLQEILNRKDTDAYKHARLRCDVCFKGFITDTAYNNHMKTHDPKTGAHKCDICQMYFHRRVTRNRHSEEHRVKYTCEQCGESFTNPNNLRIHFRFHKGILYECKICKKSYRYLTTYYNHKRNRHSSVTCDLCGEAFVGAHGLNNHMLKSHREAFNCRCSSCGIRFLNDEVLQKHTSTGCTPDVKACARCGEGFPNQEDLDAHLETVHNTRKIFSCDQCDRTFLDEHTLGLHWNKVHNPNKSGCYAEKEKEYRRNRKDKRLLCNEAKMMCDLCGKGFPNKTLFTYHMRLHTGEKPHQCSMCPKTFRLPATLKSHMATHTGERPFPCSICSRSFRQLTHRISHMVTHTQEKPHACDICGKRFGLQTNMVEHKRTVHAGLPPRRRQRRPKHVDQS